MGRSHSVAYAYEPTSMVTISMAAALPLYGALNESTSSGRLEDTKIILYSRRDTSGAICKPRVLYANSHVLKTVPYFNDRKSPSTSLTRIVNRITPFESFLELLQRPSQRISRSPSTMARPLRIMIITPIAISRKTRISQTLRKDRRQWIL